MPSSQLWLVIAIPTTAVLIGILLSQRIAHRLETRLAAMHGDLRRNAEKRMRTR